MRIKLTALFTALCVLALSFVGCSEKKSDSSDLDLSSSKSESSDTADDNAVPPSDSLLEKYPVSESKIDLSKGATENMIGRSVLNKGDVSRLKEKLVNGSKGKKTTICFLGDSITEGSSADEEHQYVTGFTNWWTENIGEAEKINAGVGGTTSYLGVHRLQSSCLDYEPDIIFVEFINDTDTENYEASMDSIVRKCLKQKNNPAVIILEPTLQDGSSPQNAHYKVAKAYDIPMISYHDAIMPEIKAGNFSWEDISPDNVHPNNDGHGIMAQLLTGFAESVMSDDTVPSTANSFDDSTSAPAGDIYENAVIADKRSDESLLKVIDEGTFTEKTSYRNYVNGWKTTKGGTIKFEVNARNIGLLYVMTVDGKSGIARVTVDGMELGIANADYVGGWGNMIASTEFYTSDKAEKHTVEVKTIGEESCTFILAGLLLS